MQVHFRQAASSCNSIHLHTLTMACNYITFSHACLRACTPAYIMYRYKPVHAYVFAYTYCIIHTCMHACIYTYILSTFLHTYIPTCLHTHLHIAYIYAQRVYIIFLYPQNHPGNMYMKAIPACMSSARMRWPCLCAYKSR